ncbi:MAG TPA: alpha/beta hydrolase [Methylomirabilota bacterium]|jgi:pimeloyl-ACP methyl ester carboxylesterase|nr:alpha/beta hydrolase [Methylomirabilota bacterium]
MMTPDQTPQDRYVDVDGLRLHCLDWGNDAAPPMLLLHGFSGHSHTWDTFARAMCDRYHVVALDQRGHGDSDWAKNGAYRPDDHARDIRAVHDRLGLRAVVLIGLSMGGRNSIALTATHPAKVEKLVIVDIGPDIDPRGAARIARMAGEAPEDFGSIDEAVAYLRPHVTLKSAAAEAALRHRVEHGVKKLPDGRYTWKYDRFLRDQRRQGTVPPVDLWPAVGKITAPTLIVRGSESDVFSPDTAKRMLELIPGSQLVEIPGAGHSVPAEAPEAFERAVRQFLGV